MNIGWTLIKEGFRMIHRRREIKKTGVKRHKGNAKEICKKVVDECWNGKYFQVSNGHFCEFYMRDFGFCVDSLMKLGYKEEVQKTLEYVLGIYSKSGLKTTITPEGRAIDVYMYAPDTLAYLIRSLRVARAYDLVKKYNAFLVKEIDKFYKSVLNKKTGLVKRRPFSSMKDVVIRRSSTYDNSMMAMLSMELDKLGIHNPFEGYDIKFAIKNNLWNGKYFYDDLKKKKHVTGDSNVFPFWLGVFDDEDMLKSCIKEIRKAGLDDPFPLKYSKKGYHSDRLNIVILFAGDYEYSNIWMHMGPLYVDLVKRVYPKLAKKYIKQYTDVIQKHGNFLEVFNEEGEPYSTACYYSDEGMLWAANYLALLD